MPPLSRSPKSDVVSSAGDVTGTSWLSRRAEASGSAAAAAAEALEGTQTLAQLNQH